MRSETSIIGTGALGTTLARALTEKGFMLRSLYNRTEERVDLLAEELGVTTRGTFPETGSELGKLVFLAVPDSEIPDVVDRLAERADNFSGKVVAHCSGNETSALLSPVRVKGGVVAAFHPLQTFHRSSLPEVFEDIYITLEGDDPAVKLLSRVVADLGAIALPVKTEAKPYLHAAAVVVCNYMMVLTGMAQEISRLGGLEPRQVRKALFPLMKTTLENSSAPDLSTVLSGPVARGDVDTVSKHLEILEPDSDLLQLYKQLGTYLLKISRGSSSGESKDLDRIQELFT